MFNKFTANLDFWKCVIFGITKFPLPAADIDYLETWRGMTQAKQLGLAKSIGVCNFNLAQMERLWANSDVKPAVLQVKTNLNTQQPELREFCHNHGIALVGTLFPSCVKEYAPPPRADDPQLTAIAAKYNKTVLQVVLRYLFELGVTPIPRSVTTSRIAENLDIFDFRLDEFDRRQLASYHNNYTVDDESFRDYFPLFRPIHVGVILHCHYM